MVKLFALYAILLFSKKAPQLIKDLLNVKGDNVGLKGLNIKNKLGEAPIVGKHVKRGMEGISGRAKGAAGGALGGLRAPKGQKLKAVLSGSASGYQKGKTAAANGNIKGLFGKSYKDSSNVSSGGKPSFFAKAKDAPKQLEDNAIKWVLNKGDKRFSDPNVKENNEKLMKIKGDLTAKVGALKADQIMQLALSDLKKYEDKMGGNLTEEQRMKYLTEGKIWDDKEHKYVQDVRRDLNGNKTEVEYKGLDAAIKYSGKSDGFEFESAFAGNESIKAVMNTAYRYANIANNIDAKKALYEDDRQKYENAASIYGKDSSEAIEYMKAAENSFGKYCDALSTANDANLIKVDVLHYEDGKGNKIYKINNEDRTTYDSNASGNQSNILKQVSALKANADSMVQKEEIKQKEAKEKAENSGDK